MDSINEISHYLIKYYTLSDTSQMTIFFFQEVTRTGAWKMWFLCFPIFPGSAEAQVIWSGKVKRLLIAYFIGNISAKKYQNPFMCVKVTASQRWHVFWDTVYI